MAGKEKTVSLDSGSRHFELAGFAICDDVRQGQIVAVMKSVDVEEARAGKYILNESALAHNLQGYLEDIAKRNAAGTPHNSQTQLYEFFDEVRHRLHEMETAIEKNPALAKNFPKGTKAEIENFPPAERLEIMVRMRDQNAATMHEGTRAFFDRTIERLQNAAAESAPQDTHAKPTPIPSPATRQ